MENENIDDNYKKDTLADLTIEDFKSVLEFIIVVRRGGLSDDCRRVVLTLLFHLIDPLTDNKTKNKYGLTKYDIMRLTDTNNRKAEEDALKYLVDNGYVEKSKHTINKVSMTLYRLDMKSYGLAEKKIPGLAKYHNFKFAKLFSAIVAYTKEAGLSDGERDVAFLLHINNNDDMYKCCRMGKCDGITKDTITRILQLSKPRVNIAIKKLVAKKLIKKCTDSDGDTKNPAYYIVDDWRDILDKNAPPGISISVFIEMMARRPTVSL